MEFEYKWGAVGLGSRKMVWLSLSAAGQLLTPLGPAPLEEEEFACGSGWRMLVVLGSLVVSQVVNRKSFSVLEGETPGGCRDLADILLCSCFKLGEMKVAWNLEGRLEKKRLWVQERMVWRLGLLLGGWGSFSTVKDNRSWLGGKEGKLWGM